MNFTEGSAHVLHAGFPKFCRGNKIYLHNMLRKFSWLCHEQELNFQYLVLCPFKLALQR